MTTLEFQQLDMSVSATLSRYGSLPDSLFEFSYKFTGGKIYSLVGQLGSGNWALPYILYGKEKLRTDSDGGKILIDGCVADNKLLREKVCYVGEHPIEEPGNKFIREHSKRWTIAEIIKRGLEATHSKYSLKDIVDIFHLSGYDFKEGRVYRNLDYVSGERWIATLAMGYACGKKVFAYPLLSANFFRYINAAHEFGTFDFLKSNGAIILVPTVKEENISAFTDEILYMDDIKQRKYDEKFQKGMLINKESDK